MTNPRDPVKVLATFEHLIEPEPMSGCWLWLGFLSSGYGRLTVTTSSGRKTIAAHRFVYEQVNGRIPAGLLLDHLCRVRCCVNPAHLEPVTLKENIRRGESPFILSWKAGVCFRGHVMNGPRYDSSRHAKQCRECYNSKRRSHIKLRRASDPEYRARKALQTRLGMQRLRAKALAAGAEEGK